MSTSTSRVSDRDVTESEDVARLNAYTLMCASFATVGSLLYGIDSGIISTTIAHESFTEYFAPYTVDVSGAVVSTFSGGSFIGVVCAGWMADQWGRKRTIQFAALWALISGAIQAGSVHIGMFIAGRIIGGFAVGILNMVIPIYNSEISPRVGGLVSGLHAQSVSVGFCVANWIGYGFSFASGQFQWRFPLAIQCFPAIVLLIGIQLLPFSPRWLLEKGREQEALVVHKKLNEAGGTYSAKAQLRHFNEMRAQIMESRQNQVASSLDLFLTPSYRRRLLLAVIVQLFAQLSGVSVINFQTDLYKGIGVTGHNITLLAGIYGTVGPISNIICLSYVDRSGRKFALWFTSFQSDNRAGKAATIAFIFLFSAIFSLGYNTISMVYVPEILSQPIRAKGSALAGCCSLVANIVLNQISPRAFATIGYKYYTFFIAANLLGATLVFFLFVETKGKTLEEIGTMFGQPVPATAEESITLKP
ncbi:general substrate transporter [Hymenopellis radicata]|nr:general substrate transporter [Hymenopellis radicata]